MNKSAFCSPLTFWVYALLSCLLLGCGTTLPVTREIKQVSEVASLHPNQHYLKTHMKDGSVYILHSWQLNPDSTKLQALGKHLDINRNLIRSSTASNAYMPANQFSIPMDSIALFETNQIGESVAGGLGVVTGIVGLTSLICIINPKTCFGSCPTFYAFDGDTMTIMAEGFSSSIAPCFERNDIDMLYHAEASRQFELHVTNEALETHSIRYANLLTYPIETGERVFVTPDATFYRCNGITPPQSCVAPAGDCRTSILHADQEEYFSLADSHDLNTREEISLTFAITDDQMHGLIIGKRQTMMTTYLMYQGLAYMGKGVSYWLAALERGESIAETNAIDMLGGIEVFLQDEHGHWRKQGEVHETGPIATDYKIVPLPDAHKGINHLRLRLNKGLWRLDYLAIAAMIEPVTPTVVLPSEVVLVNGSEKKPLSKLINPDDYLVTYPGDAYRLIYDLPYNNTELFLDSRGFYLEWIREQWIEEQSFARLNQFINHPDKFLKKVAGVYKAQEHIMEETFWNSRYEQHH